MKLRVPETNKALCIDIVAYAIIMFVSLTILPIKPEFLAQYGGKMNLVLFQAFGYGFILQTMRVIRGFKK
jgi:hypothetical protein